MSDPKADKFALTPWHLPVAVEDVADTGSRFDLVADADVRAAAAHAARLRDLPRLEANFDVQRHGSGLRVVGRVSATVDQVCVVTLEPLTNEINEDIELLFVPAAPSSANGDDAAASELGGDETELLVDGTLDLGALATEFLILGIDPYPRKPGAVFQTPHDGHSDQGPFAALAALKKDPEGS